MSTSACRARQWRQANPEKVRTYKSRYRATHKEAEAAQRRRRQVQTAYGLEPEQHVEMLEEQGGACAICGKPEKVVQYGKVRQLTVDHCHVTGKVRSLLCAACNTMLGASEDNPARLRQGADYIDSFKE